MYTFILFVILIIINIKLLEKQDMIKTEKILFDFAFLFLAPRMVMYKKPSIKLEGVENGKHTHHLLN